MPPPALLQRLAVVLALAAVAGCAVGPAGGAGQGGSAGTAGAGGVGGTGGQTSAAQLVVPSPIALPYVLAGAGGSVATVEVANSGGSALPSLSWALAGSPLLTLVSAPDALGPGEVGALVVAFEGAPSEAIVAATLEVTSPEASAVADVFAVAGDPALGAGAWEDVAGAGGFACGEGATLAMPAAPFPHAGAPFDDPSVRIFVPEGYRDRGAQDVVVHFHGHSTTLADTLAGHRYEQHVCSSGANAVLVVPQGPVLTASGDFGKLMEPGGLEALLAEVLVALYRDGRISSPRLGDLVLTSHSGGYIAVATNLDPTVNALPVREVELFDSVYGYEASYVAYAEAGGALRSNYTAGGGTLDNNQAVVAALEADGFTVSSSPTMAALRDPAPLVYFADTTHGGATRLEGAYGEQLRFLARHHRHGPRVELREAVASAGVGSVRWFAPHDDDTTGYRVELSTEGGPWQVVAEVGADASQASFPLAGGGAARVVPIVAGLLAEDALPSDTYRLEEGAAVLVVDGFSRVLDGSWGGLSHDFAARVGAGVGAVATVSSRAVTEDGLDLGAWPAVVWLTGDESTADRSLDASERAALEAYVAGGGALVVSGSEVGWDLSASAAGSAFLADVFGAALAADDAGQLAVAGAGSLAGVPPFGYAGPDAPYAEEYPDVFAPTAGGEVVLVYGAGGLGAAVGVPGRAVIVGFPLELVDENAALAEVLGALLGFVGA